MMAMPIYNSTSSTTSGGASTVWVNIATTNSTTATTTTSHPMWISSGNSLVASEALPQIIRLDDGRRHSLKFQDGTVIEVQPNGSFAIHDDNAKVIYRANRVRDFNPFLNASDKIEEFIKYCGGVGVRQGDMLGIPLKHFIGWLIIEAARADGEPEPEVLLLPNLRREAKPRCVTCGRFLSPRLRTKNIEFCRTLCFERRFMIASAA